MSEGPTVQGDLMLALTALMIGAASSLLMNLKPGSLARLPRAVSSAETWKVSRISIPHQQSLFMGFFPVSDSEWAVGLKGFVTSAEFQSW